MDQFRQSIRVVIGIDLGDRYSYLHELAADTGETLSQSRLSTSPEAFARHFASQSPARVALEVGSHSPWVDRLLQQFGHEVLLANPRSLTLIHGSSRKRDELDAERLARLARLDPKLLAPIRHRSLEVQVDRAKVKSRAALVRCRTQLINHARTLVKSFGVKLPACDSTCFHKRAAEQLPESLRPALQPVLESIAAIAEQLKRIDKELRVLAKEYYPETEFLRQVKGVGLLVSLAFVLTLEDPSRFAKSRDVPAYLGLVPRQRQSGERDPSLGISKQGDKMLRTLLVQAAQYQLGKFGCDSDLRRFGLRLAEGGGRSGKKRAIIAVARKLSVLLHHLWLSGEVYEPLYNSKNLPEAA